MSLLRVKNLRSCGQIQIARHFDLIQTPTRRSLYLKGAQSRLNGLKSLAKLFNFVVFQSVSIFSILVPLCFVIISLVFFFYLCKVLISGFLQINSNFVNAQNNSKYRD